MSGGQDAARALREENAALRALIERQDERLARLEEAQGLASVDAAEEKPFDIELSGFLKSDFLWSDARMNSSSAPRFVRRGSGTDDQFSGTVQNSRFITRIQGPKVGDVSLRGYVEADLFNIFSDTNVTNNMFRLRQLYIALDHPSWTLLMGQTWDLFGPLNVATINTNGNLWFGGNAGFRRPQVQLRGSFEVAEGHKLVPAVSVNSNIGVSVNDQGDITDSGRDAGTPVVEGSLIYELAGYTPQPMKIGVSGLYGEEEVDSLNKDVGQWGVGGHIVLPFTSRIQLVGELSWGSNLNAFLTGGGFDPVTGKKIKATSGWVQLTVDPTDSLELNAIFGVDDPYDSDLNPGALSKNRVIAANAKYTLYRNFVIGIEYERFDTHYLGESKEDSNLVWLSGILNF